MLHLVQYDESKLHYRRLYYNIVVIFQTTTVPPPMSDQLSDGPPVDERKSWLNLSYLPEPFGRLDKNSYFEKEQMKYLFRQTGFFYFSMFNFKLRCVKRYKPLRKSLIRVIKNCKPCDSSGHSGNSSCSSSEITQMLPAHDQTQARGVMMMYAQARVCVTQSPVGVYTRDINLTIWHAGRDCMPHRASIIDSVY